MTIEQRRVVRKLQLASGLNILQVYRICQETNYDLEAAAKKAREITFERMKESGGIMDGDRKY